MEERFIGPEGRTLRIDEDKEQVEIGSSSGWVFYIPLPDFEAFVAFWNERDPLLCAAPELLEVARLAAGAFRLCIPQEVVPLLAKREEAWKMLCEARFRLEEAIEKAEGGS